MLIRALCALALSAEMAATDDGNGAACYSLFVNGQAATPLQFKERFVKEQTVDIRFGSPCSAAVDHFVTARLSSLLRLDCVGSTLAEVEQRINLLEQMSLLLCQHQFSRSDRFNKPGVSLQLDRVGSTLSGLAKTYAGGGFQGLSSVMGLLAEVLPEAANSKLRSKSVHVVARDRDQWIIIAFRLHISSSPRTGRLSSLFSSATSVLEYGISCLNVNTAVLEDAVTAQGVSRAVTEALAFPQGRS